MNWSQGLEAGARVDGHHHSLRGNHHHGTQVRALEGHAFVDEGIDGEGRVDADQQRIAVAGRLGRVVGADVAARAGPVVHDEGLFEFTLQYLAQAARQDVGGAGGREGDDDAHGFGGPGRGIGGRIGPGASAGAQAQQKGQAGPQQRAAQGMGGMGGLEQGKHGGELSALRGRRALRESPGRLRTVAPVVSFPDGATVEVPAAIDLINCSP